MDGRLVVYVSGQVPLQLRRERCPFFDLQSFTTGRSLLSALPATTGNNLLESQVVEILGFPKRGRVSDGG